MGGQQLAIISSLNFYMMMSLTINYYLVKKNPYILTFKFGHFPISAYIELSF